MTLKIEPNASRLDLDEKLEQGRGSIVAYALLSKTLTIIGSNHRAHEGVNTSDRTHAEPTDKEMIDGRITDGFQLYMYEFDADRMREEYWKQNSEHIAIVSVICKEEDLVTGGRITFRNITCKGYALTAYGIVVRKAILVKHQLDKAIMALRHDPLPGLVRGRETFSSNLNSSNTNVTSRMFSGG